ncbi:TetR/AcrR family transcriptional regulator [Streptomyces fractus]|uniref:TetR/AcrR family transcriptional regulator n=1 Tax=Streptomyces fractus TaxID=641806 RepID=UPI003CEFE59C
MTAHSNTHDGPAAPGSPAWWATRPGTPSAPRRGRPSVDPGHIVKAALQLVDEHGVQAFSLRMLADHLGSGTATLYRHFAGKDEILAHIVDRVLGEPDLRDLDTFATWQETLTVTANRLYEALRRHPAVVPPLMAQIPVGPNGLAQRERVLHALLDRGLPPAFAARAFTAVGHYVIGFTIQQHGPAAADPAAGRQLAAFYRNLGPDEYPALTQTADALTVVPLGEEFSFGLDCLISGLARKSA